jgi:hypothetical protein
MINMELRKTGKEIQKRSDKDDPKKGSTSGLAWADSPYPAQLGKHRINRIEAVAGRTGRGQGGLSRASLQRLFPEFLSS